jgi:hypothetical protein
LYGSHVTLSTSAKHLFESSRLALIALVLALVAVEVDPGGLSQRSHDSERRLSLLANGHALHHLPQLGAGRSELPPQHSFGLAQAIGSRGEGELEHWEFAVRLRRLQPARHLSDRPILMTMPSCGPPEQEAAAS